MSARRPGFTLIELLIALGASALIASAIYSLLYTGARSWMRMRERSDIQQIGRVVAERLESDLQGAVPLTQGALRGQFPFHGTAADLRFATRLSMPSLESISAETVIAEVTWGRKDVGSPVVRGCRLLSPLGKDQAAAPSIGNFPPELAELSFQYAYASSDKESAPQWQPKWNDETRIPAGVKAHLVIRGAHDEMAFDKTIGIWQGALGKAEQP